MAENEATKTRKRRGVKAAAPEDAESRKLNVTVTTKVYLRLVNHSAKTRKPRGVLVDEAIAFYLAAEKAGRRGGDAGEDESTE